MRRIRSKNTRPEIAVRQMLRRLGFPGYRLHRTGLPGRPDIAFIGRRKAIFVHGCFWHGHSCPEGLRRPKTNVDFWANKIAGNQSRDAKHHCALAESGWSSLAIWDCELRDSTALEHKVLTFFKPAAERN